VYEEGDTKAAVSLSLVTAGFDNYGSWFGESESFLGVDSDGWMEIGAEPGLTVEFALGNGTAFGGVSGVYTGTFNDDASGLTAGMDDPDDFTLEQAHLGWRLEDVFAGLANDTVSVSLGRQDYSIGTGLIINDGSADGGERGGWYIGLRKAFPHAAIVRLKSDELLLEAFDLENDPRRGGTDGDATGVNGEYYFGGKGMLGGSFLVVNANLAGYDDLDVYSVRGEIRPLAGLSLSGEYVNQDSDQIEADGYYAQGLYEFETVKWKPGFTYRFAHFDGDDPNTDTDEQYREIAYGSTDYGYWVQGEITGNYPLGNGNLESHMVRAKMTPIEAITVGLFYYDFTLDQEQIFGEIVSSDDWGDEVNVTVDWQATDRIYVIGVMGTLMPGDAAQEWVGGSDDWRYAMLYFSFAL